MVYLRGFVEKFFGESSIHCFPYVVRSDFHFFEKMFWLVLLAFSGYCGFLAFSGQLYRYNENPTVLSIEILSEGEFERPSFTICSNYTNTANIESFITKLWNVNSTSPNYQLHVDFVMAVTDTTYKNMDSLGVFSNISEFNKADLLMIAREMKTQTAITSHFFAHVITEMGMCQSSSKYFRFQNPFFKNKTVENKPKEVNKHCSSLEVCRTSVSPNNIDPASENVIYVNTFDEVMTGDAIDYEALSGTMIIEKVVKFDQIVAEKQLIKLKPKSRKCLFASEPQSQHFDVYTINLCKIDCRIKQALRFCHCIPFFYTVHNVKVCDIKGMICLSKQQWYTVSRETGCECPNLCENQIMTKVSSKVQDLNFDRMLTIDMVFPKTRIQRSVLFSFDDLVVGFGGSVALFLGFSFLTGVELMYFVMEYLLELLINVMKSHIIKTDRISEPQKMKLLSTKAPY